MAGKMKGAFQALLLLAVISLALMLTRSAWQPLLLSITNLSNTQLEAIKLRLDLLLGIISLVSTLGTIAVFVYRRSGSPARSEALQKTPLLTPTSPQALINAIPNPIGRKLFWIDRGLIPADLTANRCIAITGNGGFGKTREAAEILRKLSQSVGEKDIYLLSNDLFAFSPNRARRYLASQLVQNSQPILLLDNPPVEQLPRLDQYLAWLWKNQGYVIITVPSAGLGRKQLQWLKKHAFSLIITPVFFAKPCERLVEEIFARLGFGCSPEALQLLAKTTIVHESPAEMIRFVVNHFQAPKGASFEREDVTQVTHAINQVRWDKSFKQFPLLKTMLVAVETLVDAGIPLDFVLIQSFTQYLAQKEAKRLSWLFSLAYLRTLSYLRVCRYLREEDGKLVYKNNSYHSEKNTELLCDFLTGKGLQPPTRIQFGRYVTLADLKLGYKTLLARKWRKIEAQNLGEIFALLQAHLDKWEINAEFQQAAEIVSELTGFDSSQSVDTMEINHEQGGFDLLLNDQYLQAFQAFFPVHSQNMYDPIILHILSTIYTLAADAENGDKYRLNAARRYQHYATQLRLSFEFEKAALLLEMACHCNPQNASAWGELGFANHMLNANEKAAQAYQTALALTPRNPEFHFSLGLALVKLGKLDQALYSFQQAVTIAPELFKYRLPYWGMLFFSCRFAEIIQEHHQNPAFIEQSQDARTLLGLALAMDAMAHAADTISHGIRSASLEEAIAVYSAALEPEPGPPENTGADDIQYFLASFFRLNQEPDKAVVVLLDLIARRPSQAIYHIGLCHVLRLLGDPQAEEALRNAEELIAAAPGIENAAFALLCGEKERALGLLKSCLMERGGEMEFTDFKRIWLRYDPDFALLHGDPQFLQLNDLTSARTLNNSHGAHEDANTDENG
jgi:tetratricopeptide (TPR) repeat protein